MNSRLIAVKIRRRSLCIAIFADRALEYAERLQLCDEPEAAMDSLARLLGSALGRFRPEAAALSLGTTAEAGRVKLLAGVVEQMFRAEGIPFEVVEHRPVLESYAVPRLKSNRQLRSSVQLFWPHLPDRQLAAYEAIALGFYVQIDRTLSCKH